MEKKFDDNAVLEKLQRNGQLDTVGRNIYQSSLISDVIWLYQIKYATSNSHFKSPDKPLSLQRQSKNDFCGVVCNYKTFQALIVYYMGCA